MEPSYFGVRVDQFIDAIQTLAIMIVIVYVTIAFGRFHYSSKSNDDRLTAVLNALHEVQAGLERAWKRIDDIETRQGIRGDIDQIGQLKRVIDAMQAALRVPPNDNKPGEKP